MYERRERPGERRVIDAKMIVLREQGVGWKPEERGDVGGFKRRDCVGWRLDVM